MRNPDSSLALSVAQMAILSRLLDEALALDSSGRLMWLESLAPQYQDLTQILRDALFPEPTKPAGRLDLSTLPSLNISDDDADSPGLAAGEHIGPYQLIRSIGAGGMAEVWLARRADGAFNREVALKLPLGLHLRRDLEVRFARERDILASMSHPNIAQLYDTGFTPRGQPYLALEYVAGSPITSYCDEHFLNLRQRLELFLQVLDAVHYAHANLVIHRDLKPSNILVTREGRAQLLDFGIAKLLVEDGARETELTRLTGRAMTPDYAAPEQVLGAAVTTAADVYGLGVMLYEILTGERPYRLKRRTQSALEEAIVKSEPVAPSRASLSANAAKARRTSPYKLSGMLKGDLDTIVLKALKKSPQERYPTAAAFREDIHRYLHGQVVLARPDRLSYRARKFARRHWVVISFAGALLLALALGLAAASYEARVAATQRDRARIEAATSEQVTSYLESLFDLASPDVTGSKPIDARTLVEHGQRQISAIPANQQLLRGRVLAAVGALDCKIGKSAQCRENLEAALRIQSTQADADPLRLAKLRYQLAMAYNSAGRADKAIALLQQARAVVEQHQPRDTHQLAAIWCELGFAARLKEQTAEAVAAFERSRALFRDAWGNDTLESARTLGMLAIMLAETSHTSEAVDLANKRLELVSNAFGTDDPRYLDALNDYAEVANARYESAAAEKAWRQVVEGYTRLYGRGSDKAINAELSLADAFMREDKLSDSIAWLRRSVADYRSNGDLNTTQYTGALGTLSQVLGTYGDYEGAAAAAREAYEISQRMHGPTEVDAFVIGMRWAHGLDLTGNTEQALKLLRPELPAYSNTVWGQSYRGQRLMWIADCYRNLGHLKQAEEGYDAVFAYYRSINREHAVVLAMAYKAKADLLAAERRYAEAVPLYILAKENYAASRYLADGPSISAVNVELAESLLALGRRAEARALVTESGPVVERELAPTHPTQAVLERLRKSLHLTRAANAADGVNPRRS
jgi:serine/threonine protein kinase